jgi:efflux transporter, outer membrane factor (OMF) lipoprotein, NodT family
MASVRLSVVAAGLALLLAGCMVGPDYERPDAPVPTAFKEQQPGWKQAEPNDGVDRGAWWGVFNDPLLDALMHQVVVSNQTLKASEAAFRQARALVEQSRSDLFPIIGLDASVDQSHSSTGSRSGSAAGFSGGSGGRNETVYSTSLGASWELDVWGRIRRTVESDVASAQATAADLATATLSAQADLASFYFQLRALDAQQQLLDRSAAAYEKSLQITSSQYKWGIVPRGDVALAETQLQTTRSQAIAVGVQRAQLEHAIAVLLGEPPAEFSIDPTSMGEVPPSPPAGVPSELLERRPDVAAAERRMASANALIGVAEAAWYPDINLSATFGYAATGLGGLFSAANQAWSVGVALAQTLIDAGARRAQVEGARAAYDQTVADYRQTVLASLQGVEDQLSALRILQQQAAVQDQAVAAAEEAERLQLNQYKAGTVDYTSVVTAQQSSLSNQQTALTIRQSRFVATVELIRALGGGWTEAQVPEQIGSVVPRPF